MYWFHVTPQGAPPFGPIDENAIIAMIRQGQLRGAHICAQGQQQWVPIDTYPPFAQALAGGAPVFGAVSNVGVPGATASVVPGIAPMVGRPAVKRSKPGSVVGIVLGALVVVGVAGRLVWKKVSKRTYPPPDGQLTHQEVSGDDDGHIVLTFRGRGETRVVMPREMDCSTLKGGAYLEPDLDTEMTCDIRQFPYGETSKAKIIFENFGGDQKSISLEFARTRRVRLNIGAGDYSVDASLWVFGADTLRGNVKGVTLSVEEAPVGAKLTWFGKTVTVGKEGTASVAGDGIPIVNEMTVTALFANPEQVKSVQRGLKIEFADGMHVEGTVEIKAAQMKSYLASALTVLDPAKSGVLFPGETADTAPSPRRGMYVQGELYGTPATVAEIDLIGMTNNKDRKHSCGTYVSNTGESATAYVYSVITVATAYERRTGKQIAQKSFEGHTPRCTRTSSSLYLGSGDPVSTKVVSAWFAGLVPKTPVAPVAATAPVATPPAHR